MRSLCVRSLLLPATALLVIGLLGVRYVPSQALAPSRAPRLELAPPTLRSSAADPTRRSPSTDPRLRPQDFRLLGTILDERPVAIIGEKATGKVRQYGINDHLGPATVKEIRRGSVRLVAYGRDTVLLLDPSTSSLPPILDPAAATVSIAAGASRDPRVPAAVQLRPQLSATTREFEGLALAVLDPPQLAQQLGLEAGDLIVAVNGQRLTSPQQTLQVLKKAWQGSSVRLEGMRDEGQFMQEMSLQHLELQ